MYVVPKLYVPSTIKTNELMLLGELIYAWKKVRLRSRLGSNLTFFPGSVNLEFFP